jgi:hypothetical protein
MTGSGWASRNESEAQGIRNSLSFFQLSSICYDSLEESAQACNKTGCKFSFPQY